MISSSRRWRVAALALGCCTTLSLACATRRAPTTPAEAPAATAQPEAKPVGVPVKAAEVQKGVDPIEGPIPLAPPDGKWLVDEIGRPYFVHRINKVGHAWAWVEEGKKVQLIRGLTFDVVDYDERSFWVKIYGSAPNSPAARRQANIEAEQARVAGTYVTDTRTGDRLRLVPWSQGLPATGQWRNGFAIADMNGDGELDIAHGPPRKGGSRPVIFLGDGKGSWRPWTAARFPELPFDYGDAAAADFNGDGKMDLALASHLRGIVALLGDGQGGFTAWSDGIDFAVDVERRAGDLFSSRAIEIVDWNLDGRPDILALGEGPRMTVVGPATGTGYSRGARNAVIYLNQGDGKWVKQQHSADQDGLGTFGDQLAVGDFNADGRPDFLAASAQKGNKSLLHLGTADGSWQYTTIEPLRPAASFRGVGAGDFDGDGRLDLAVGYLTSEAAVSRTGIEVLLARAEGGWDRRLLAVEQNKNQIWSLDVGDLNGDRALDIVAIDGYGLPWVFVGDGKGSFMREESPELRAPDQHCTGYAVSLVDLDRDGTDEVVAGYAGEGTELLGEPKCVRGGALRVWRSVGNGKQAP